MKYLLICRLLLSSHYYLQLNQNADMLFPCCCLVFAELSMSQSNTPTMQYTQPCQYLIWMLTGQHRSPSQPANQAPKQLKSQMEFYFPFYFHFEVINLFLCQCGQCNIVCLSIKHSYTQVESDIMCLMHVAHNLGCGTLMSPPETNSLDEGSHPSAAGPHNSCLTRQWNEEFVPEIRASASLCSREMKDYSTFGTRKRM